ncbi:MAG TPA: DUF4266 domain-containing protein [Pseudomonadota bacterium]|nr:DUF4266 domain-containing protein [Pseudomonadota bacterium]
MRDLRWACLGLLLASLCGVSGCTMVKPYQRELLAKRIMALDPPPEAALLEQHVYQYREGSAGGYGGGGGGCGCN